MGKEELEYVDRYINNAEKGGSLVGQLTLEELEVILNFTIAFEELHKNDILEEQLGRVNETVERMLCYLLLIRRCPEYLPKGLPVVPLPETGDIEYVELPEDIDDFLDSLESGKKM